MKIIRFLTKRTVACLVITLISLFVFSFILFKGTVRSYEFTLLLPLVYILFFSITYSGRVSREKPIFFLVLLTFGFIRYVMYPFLLAYLGEYEGRSWVPPKEESIELAVLLMCYELIAVTIFIYFLEKIRHNKIINTSNYNFKSISLSFSLLMLVLSTVMLFVFTNGSKVINFLIPTVLNDDVLMSLSLADKLSAYYFLLSKQIFIIGIVFFLHKKFVYSRGKSKYLYLSIFFVLANSIIYYGTNRTDIVITAIVTYIIFHMIFGKISLKYVLSIAFICAITVSVVTQEREYHHKESFAENSLDYALGYTGGVYNVALGVEVKDWFPEASEFRGLALDFVRPMIGLGFLVSTWEIDYSNIHFNNRVWTHVERRSQILPMIAQGYIYFDTFFAPVLSLFFVFLYYILEFIYNRVVYVEIKYFLLLSMARMGFLFGQNSMNIINNLSFNFFLLVLVFLTYKLFVYASNGGKGK